MSKYDKVQSLTRRNFIRATAIAGAAISAPLVLTSRKSSAAMTAPTSTPEDDALAAFKSAVDAFNNKDSYKLGSLLADNVELRKVHINHGKPVIIGRDPVVNYLKGAWNGVPPVSMIFRPFSGGQKPDPVDVHGPNKTIADITGLACWNDNDGDNADGQLKYKFVLEKTGSAWLITSLAGNYTGNPNPCPPP
ncbi:MAG TPA: twin-arginine translocation signal domain-containing protein [Candidatus Acidoferrales bacterium]|nr:twin-arginine translocation signal domain-containing protein [Candidatus Acidoferrales bacterium]